MEAEEYKPFYRRNLPHLQPAGGTFFVTYRLQGSLPKGVIEKIQNEFIREKQAIFKQSQIPAEDIYVAQKKYFKKFDQLLDKSPSGFHWLRQNDIANVVKDTLHFWDDTKLELIAYTIMSNHVHVVFRLFEYDAEKNLIPLHKIMQSIKTASSRQCNKMLSRKGKKFWQNENYDHWVRDANELYNIVLYTLDNPVKAGLCKTRTDWKWNYVKPMYNEFM